MFNFVYAQASGAQQPHFSIFYAFDFNFHYFLLLLIRPQQKKPKNVNFTGFNQTR